MSDMDRMIEEQALRDLAAGLHDDDDDDDLDEIDNSVDESSMLDESGDLDDTGEEIERGLRACLC